ncbi:MAG TPA: 6-phosphogluconolactonase [Ilumatobacteraceae bacterium]|nr:6-phosphogluconolactonase [Ilumatobacteraceae bacterium]
MEVRIASNAGEAATLAAAQIAHWLRAAARDRGVATMALSGGRTPIAMVQLLADLDVPWPDVRVYQVDERAAPDGDDARNAALLEVLGEVGAVVHPMPVTASDRPAAAREYAASLPAQFDVVHLGIGDDGHTASWPPGDPVADLEQPVAWTGRFNGYDRMTLTPGPVNDARHRLVLVTEGNKAAVVARWLDGDRDLPITRVHRSDTVLIATGDVVPDAAG